MSLSCRNFFSLLAELGVEFYTGVPDSLLKHFCTYVSDHVSDKNHVVAANEGNAIAIAAGYHLGTRSIPVVYMQNSGLGNAVNPLLSLCDPGVYSIPMLLLVGWRGEPGTADEPQHETQGGVTTELLEVMGVPHMVLSQHVVEYGSQLKAAVALARERETPFVLLVRKGTFSPEPNTTPEPDRTLMFRERAIETIVTQLEPSDLVVGTTGKTSRELFEINERLKYGRERAFLCVGSMGHSSSIALGLALAQPHRQIFCLDGDGALIMHMGSAATIGDVQAKNFKHILINNGVHESVGGQRTAAEKMNFRQVLSGAAYRHTAQVVGESGLPEAIRHLREQEGPSLLEIVVQPGSRNSLGRPTISPRNNKAVFMQHVCAQAPDEHPRSQPDSIAASP